jgi:hypothetical protein
VKSTIPVLLFVVSISAILFVGLRANSNKQVDASKPVYTSHPLNAETLTSLVNDWRVKSGFQPYIKQESLCRIASDRLPEVKVVFNHDAFVEKYYNKYASGIQENLVKSLNEDMALFQWLHSEAHRATLERNYKYSCIATSDMIGVQIFSNCENGCP